MTVTQRSCGLGRVACRRFGTIGGVLTAAVAAAAIGAPGASASTACIYRTFSETNTYQSCTLDEQVLLDDLYQSTHSGWLDWISTDGYYGPATYGDVWGFKLGFEVYSGTAGITTPVVWTALCEDTLSHGWHGAYWHAAGCNIILPDG